MSAIPPISSSGAGTSVRPTDLPVLRAMTHSSYDPNIWREISSYLSPYATQVASLLEQSMRPLNRQRDVVELREARDRLQAASSMLNPRNFSHRLNQAAIDGDVDFLDFLGFHERFFDLSVGQLETALSFSYENDRSAFLPRLATFPRFKDVRVASFGAPICSAAKLGKLPILRVLLSFPQARMYISAALTLAIINRQLEAVQVICASPHFATEVRNSEISTDIIEAIKQQQLAIAIYLIRLDRWKSAPHELANLIHLVHAINPIPEVLEALDQALAAAQAPAAAAAEQKQE